MSEDETVEMETVSGTKTTKTSKLPKSEKAVKSNKSERKPIVVNKGKGRQIVQDSSSSKLESGHSEDDNEDDDEGEALPSSGLEDLEKNLGTLKVKFESEVGTQCSTSSESVMTALLILLALYIQCPAWVDNGSQLPKDDDLQYDHQNDLQGDAQGEFQFEVQHDIQDHIHSPSYPLLDSPPGSPPPSCSHAGPVAPSSLDCPHSHSRSSGSCSHSCPCSPLLS